MIIVGIGLFVDGLTGIFITSTSCWTSVKRSKKPAHPQESAWNATATISTIKLHGLRLRSSFATENSGLSDELGTNLYQVIHSRQLYSVLSSKDIHYAKYYLQWNPIVPPLDEQHYSSFFVSGVKTTRKIINDKIKHIVFYPCESSKNRSVIVEVRRSQCEYIRREI